jgi:polysaccharide export outer membrane protein
MSFRHSSVERPAVQSKDAISDKGKLMRSLELWILTVVLASVVLGFGVPGMALAQSSDKSPKELGPASAPTTQEAVESVKEPVQLPKSQIAAPVDPKTYEIGVEDILFVHVWKENDLTRGVQVRPDGKITLPLIGDLQAAGRTPEQLTEDIVEALAKFINKPVVTVSVSQVLSRKYYITGAVNRPGQFSLVVPITVLEALTNAGGFGDFANTKKIRILRKDGTTLYFNYKDVSRGKNLDQNIFLQNGDFIIVPD